MIIHTNDRRICPINPHSAQVFVIDNKMPGVIFFYYKKNKLTIKFVCRHQSSQLRDANANFEDRETLERTSNGEEAWAPPGEVVVGGVYLKLFLQHPHWNLRSPKRFLQELLTETLSALSKDSTEVRLTVSRHITVLPQAVLTAPALEPQESEEVLARRTPLKT